MSIKQFISRDVADTERAAAEIAAAYPDGAVIALEGDLGAGKTVFSRGFGRALGITEPISSPTYTIIQEYRCPDGRDFYHLDLYRIDNPAAALALGVDEYFDRPGSFALIEWPERIDRILPDGVVRIKIRHLGENEREIQWEIN